MGIAPSLRITLGVQSCRSALLSCLRDPAGHDVDIDRAAQAMREEEMLQEIEDFLEGFNQPTYSGVRINGQRVAAWSSQHGWSGDSRPEARSGVDPLSLLW
jgi:hypothetical protein